MADVREVSITLPEDVVTAAAALASRESRSVGDLMKELLSRHEELAGWRELKRVGQERAAALGYTEGDVDRLIRTRVRKPLIRVVLDTSVYVSGVQFGGVPRKILDAAIGRRFQLVASSLNRWEVERVLAEKFSWRDDDLLVLTEASGGWPKW